MPKPRWGWFGVAIVAVITGIFAVNAGLANGVVTGGPPGGLLIAGLALVAVWSFGKAFFNYRP